MGADSTGTETWIAHMILLSNIKERFEYPELRRKAQEMHDLYRPDICIIEKKASGQSLLQDLRRAGLPVLDYLPDRDKVSRVYASTPLMESGRVWLPKDKDWAWDLYEEAITFPNAAHDDQVDAMTMGIQYMRDSTLKIPTMMSSMKVSLRRGPTGKFKRFALNLFRLYTPKY